MQKLVSLCLSGYDLKHGKVQEHLGEYLSQGWRIVTVKMAGSSSTAEAAVAWVVVVLEKPGP
jgi:hypothetical protein